MGPFRLHPVYHVPSELSFLSYLYQYLLRYPGFSYYSDTWPSFLFFIVLWVVLVAFSGNNASQFLGLLFRLTFLAFCDSMKMVPGSRTTSAGRHASVIGSKKQPGQNTELRLGRGSTRAGTNTLSGTTCTPKKIGEMTEFKKRKKESTHLPLFFCVTLRHSRR